MAGKTIDDLFDLMKTSATKDDMIEIKTKIDDINIVTNDKINEVINQVESNKLQTDLNTNLLAELQTNIEILKQEK